jgi:magnesium-transporting ATPase (P-type)
MTATAIWLPPHTTLTVTGQGLVPTGDLLDAGTGKTVTDIKGGLADLLTVASLCNTAGLTQEEGGEWVGVGDATEVALTVRVACSVLCVFWCVCGGGGVLVCAVRRVCVFAHCQLTSPHAHTPLQRPSPPNNNPGPNKPPTNQTNKQTNKLTNYPTNQVLATKTGFGKENLQAQKALAPVAEFPFDSTIKRMSMAVANSATGRRRLLTKGALESLLPLCTHVRRTTHHTDTDHTNDHHNDRPLDADAIAQVRAQVETLATRGLRVLALAARPLQPEEEAAVAAEDREALEKGLVFLGLVGLMDPPRPEVRERKI